jgi:hypothetical protein
LLSRNDLWQSGSSISFGFGRHAIVTGDRKASSRGVVFRAAGSVFRKPFIKKQTDEFLQEFGTIGPPGWATSPGDAVTIQSIEGFDSGSE